ECSLRARLVSSRNCVGIISRVLLFLGFCLRIEPAFYETLIIENLLLMEPLHFRFLLRAELDCLLLQLHLLFLALALDGLVGFCLNSGEPASHAASYA